MGRCCLPSSPSRSSAPTATGPLERTLSTAEIHQVTFTVGSSDDAERLSTMLVSAGLAACVQVLGPMTSRYRWQGAIETATEWLLVAKTTAARADAVVAAVVDSHPYDVPEVLVTPVVGGHWPYLEWVAAEASTSDAEEA